MNGKIIGWLIFLIILGIGGIVFGPKAYAFVTRTRCEEVKKYTINSIDARFNMTREEYLSHIKTAEKNWEDATGMDLFEYDPEGELDFNLVFDERQELSSEIGNLEGDLDSKKEDLVPQIAEYDRLVAVYKKKVADLNSEILFYNEQGGAPEEKFREIVARQQELENEAKSLNSLAARLNQSTDDYNTEVGKLNNTVKTFNTALDYKPEQGIYSEGDERVEIYFTTNDQELVHTLMHEMGHALGIEHTDNDTDIMFSYTSGITTPSESDLSELRFVCSQNIILERYRRNIEYIKQMLIKDEVSVVAG